MTADMIAVAARERLFDNLADDVCRISLPKEAEALLLRVRALGHDPRHKAVTGRDLKAAFAIFLLVAIPTLPPTIPFILTDNVALARRPSNASEADTDIASDLQVEIPVQEFKAVISRIERTILKIAIVAIRFIEKAEPVVAVGYIDSE
ncbi:hypothetical protein PWG15_09510 [Ensifer adhaerens]|uniref:hypothetical protein n=1 Tax=Ensifer adhaerens TaxID=106592 RepID=UPI0023A9769E|nr:hypothetical protein [Ensifer adhaerens]WDZ78701.1 hypothetical protein PWG15_09510 [Ensifer adhaerens]